MFGGGGGFGAVARSKASLTPSGYFRVPSVAAPAPPRKRGRECSLSSADSSEGEDDSDGGGFVFEPVAITPKVALGFRLTPSDLFFRDEDRQRHLAALRERHLRYNPELPHLLNDPLAQNIQPVACEQALSAPLERMQRNPPMPPLPTGIAATAPEEKKKMLVFDTSALLSNDDPVTLLERLSREGYVMIIPSTVLRELDYRIKEGHSVDEEGCAPGEGSRPDRRTLRAGRISLAVRDWLMQEVQCEHPSVHIQTQFEVDLPQMRLARSNDDKILACATYFRRQTQHQNCDIIFATRDVNLTIKARAEGFKIASLDDPTTESKARYRRQR